MFTRSPFSSTLTAVAKSRGSTISAKKNKAVATRYFSHKSALHMQPSMYLNRKSKANKSATAHKLLAKIKSASEMITKHTNVMLSGDEGDTVAESAKSPVRESEIMSLLPAGGGWTNQPDKSHDTTPDAQAVANGPPFVDAVPAADKLLDDSMDMPHGNQRSLGLKKLAGKETNGTLATEASATKHTESADVPLSVGTKKTAPCPIATQTTKKSRSLLNKDWFAPLLVHNSAHLANMEDWPRLISFPARMRSAFAAWVEEFKVLEKQLEPMMLNNLFNTACRVRNTAWSIHHFKQQDWASKCQEVLTRSGAQEAFGPVMQFREHAIEQLQLAEGRNKTITLHYQAVPGTHASFLVRLVVSGKVTGRLTVRFLSDKGEQCFLSTFRSIPVWEQSAPDSDRCRKELYMAEGGPQFRDIEDKAAILKTFTGFMQILLPSARIVKGFPAIKDQISQLKLNKRIPKGPEQVAVLKEPKRTGGVGRSRAAQGSTKKDHTLMNACIATEQLGIQLLMVKLE